MTKILRAAAVLIAIVLMAAPLSAQTVITTTTTTAAITASQTRIPLTSVAGISVGDIVFLPGWVPESMRVVAVNASSVDVVRGADGTRGSAHANTKTVFVGPASRFHFADPDVDAVCIYNRLAYAPWINVKTGMIWTCWAISPTGTSSFWVGTNLTPLAMNSIGPR